MTHCYINQYMFKLKILLYQSANKIQKSLKNSSFAIIRLVLQITEHLKRNVQTSIQYIPLIRNSSGP